MIVREEGAMVMRQIEVMNVNFPQVSEAGDGHHEAAMQAAEGKQDLGLGALGTVLMMVITLRVLATLVPVI